MHHGEGKAFADSREIALTAEAVVPHDPGTENNNPWVFERQWDVAVSNYVFNTLAPQARAIEFRKLIICSKKIYLTVRTDTKAIKDSWLAFSDGYITGRGTFQAIHDADEWLHWFQNASLGWANVSILHKTSTYATFEVVRKDEG